MSSGIQWFDWIVLLGNRHLELYVDPGCVYIRQSSRSGETKLVTIWADDRHAPSATFASPRASKKTVAQLIIGDDREEDERLFAQLARECDEPCWITPVVPHFPSSARSSSPLSVISSHSRSSSYSSGGSVYSIPESTSSASSSSSSSSFGHSASPPQKLSRRERAREANVYVDRSKTEVTNYEAARTTVLTGGTMLGSSSPHRRRA